MIYDNENKPNRRKVNKKTLIKSTETVTDKILLKTKAFIFNDLKRNHK